MHARPQVDADDPPVAAEVPPALVWRVVEQGRTLGALVIDRLVAGRACGGIRVAADVTEGELRRLAATMTLKFAFFGIACGGAKAGIVMPADVSAETRSKRASAFGAALAPLLRPGTYVPGTDLGCDERDLWDVRAGSGVAAGDAPARAHEDSVGAYAGRSAAIAALTALAAQGVRPESATLTIAGYGRVGAALAERFAAAGGRLVAASTAAGAVADEAGLDVALLGRLRATHGEAAPLHYPGGRRIAPAEIFAVPADVVAPCAGIDMIDEATARALRCRVVSPGANAALTADAEAALARAGTVVLPDFVANAGGILIAHFWPLPLPAATVGWLLETRFRAIVATLLATAERTGARPTTLARALARANLAYFATGGDGGRRHEHLLDVLGRSRVRRLVPAPLLTRLVARLAADLGPPLRTPALQPAIVSPPDTLSV